VIQDVLAEIDAKLVERREAKVAMEE